MSLWNGKKPRFLWATTLKTFNSTTFTLQIISLSHCRNLEFVARCRWNGKKYFWATLLRTFKTYFGHTAAFCRKKKSFLTSKQLTLVWDRSTFLNSETSCLFKHVQTCLCHYRLLPPSFWQSYNGTFPIWNHATSIIHTAFS